MVIKRLKGGKDWQNLPGGLTGQAKAGKDNIEIKNKENTKPPKRGSGSKIK